MLLQASRYPRQRDPRPSGPDPLPARTPGWCLIPDGCSLIPDPSPLPLPHGRLHGRIRSLAVPPVLIPDGWSPRRSHPGPFPGAPGGRGEQSSCAFRGHPRTIAGGGYRSARPTLPISSRNDARRPLMPRRGDGADQSASARRCGASAMGSVWCSASMAKSSTSSKSTAGATTRVAAARELP